MDEGEELRPQASGRIEGKCSSQQVTGSLSVKKCIHDVPEMTPLIWKSPDDQVWVGGLGWGGVWGCEITRWGGEAAAAC